MHFHICSIGGLGQWSVLSEIARPRILDWRLKSMQGCYATVPNMLQGLTKPLPIGYVFSPCNDLNAKGKSRSVFEKGDHMVD